MKLKSLLVCYSKLPSREGQLQRAAQNKRYQTPYKDQARQHPQQMLNETSNLKKYFSQRHPTSMQKHLSIKIYNKILKEPVAQALQGRTLCLITYENANPLDSLTYHVLVDVIKQHTVNINWISMNKDEKPLMNEMPTHMCHPQSASDIVGLLNHVRQTSESLMHSVIQISLENPCISLCQINTKDQRWNPDNFIISFKEVSNNLNRARVKSHSRSTKSESLLQSIILNSQQVILMVDNQVKRTRRRSPIGKNIQNYIETLQIKNKRTQQPNRVSIVRPKKQESAKTKKKEPAKISDSLDKKPRLKTTMDVAEQKPQEVVSRTEKSLPKDEPAKIFKTDWSNEDQENLLEHSQLDTSALELELCQSYLKNTLVFQEQEDFIVPCTFKSQFKWNRVAQQFEQWDPQTQKALGYFTEAEQFLQQEIRELQSNLEQLHSETVSKQVETMKGEIELINSLQETRAACDPIDYADTVELAIDLKIEQLTKLKKELTVFKEKQREYESCNNKLTEAYRRSGQQATISRFQQ